MKKITSGQNGGLAIIWKCKPHYLFVYVNNASPFNFMSLPSAYKHFDTIWLDLLQKLSEIIDFSKNRTRSADLLTPITRPLINILTWEFRQSFTIAKPSPGMYYMTVLRDFDCFYPLTFDLDLNQKLPSNFCLIQTYLENNKENI